MIYHIEVPVIAAKGYQSWTVEANSKEEAIAEYLKGKGEFRGEEIEATELGDPRVIAEDAKP